jgi:hypothetical protein
MRQRRPFSAQLARRSGGATAATTTGNSIVDAHSRRRRPFSAVATRRC